MKNLKGLKMELLENSELVVLEGGSLDPDALRDYMEERYGERTYPSF